MSIRNLSAFALIALTTLAAQGFAQSDNARALMDRLQGGGVLAHFILLDQPDVQQELRLSMDQIQSVRTLGQQQRATLEGLSQLPREEAARKVMDARNAGDRGLRQILSDQQMQRLDEISLQKVGPLIALSRPEVASTLNLTAEQRSSLRDLQEKLVREAASMQQQQGGGQPRIGRFRGQLDNLARLQQSKQDADRSAMALLTSMQQMQWQQMLGAPFQGELARGPLGRRLGN